MTKKFCENTTMQSKCGHDKKKYFKYGDLIVVVPAHDLL